MIINESSPQPPSGVLSWSPLLLHWHLHLCQGHSCKHIVVKLWVPKDKNAKIGKVTPLPPDFSHFAPAAESKNPLLSQIFPLLQLSPPHPLLPSDIFSHISYIRQPTTDPHNISRETAKAVLLRKQWFPGFRLDCFHFLQCFLNFLFDLLAMMTLNPKCWSDFKATFFTPHLKWFARICSSYKIWKLPGDRNLKSLCLNFLLRQTKRGWF